MKKGFFFGVLFQAVAKIREWTFTFAKTMTAIRTEADLELICKGPKAKGSGLGWDGSVAGVDTCFFFHWWCGKSGRQAGSQKEGWCNVHIPSCTTKSRSSSSILEEESQFFPNCLGQFLGLQVTQRCGSLEGDQFLGLEQLHSYKCLSSLAGNGRQTGM